MFFCGHDGTITIQEQDPADHDARLGSQLGDYVVVARVADGAMGRVYEGRHLETKQQVAVKVLHEDVARDQVAVERFKREYETAEELDHPNVVDVIDFGETGDGSWFMTMEYLSGTELTGLLEDEGAIAPHRMVRIFCQLAAALDHAHSWGFIHRDLKPDNVFLVAGEEGDVVKVLDFGSVKLQMETGPKLTAFGTTLGSPYYMSPEQAMGKLDVDQRTDVFAAAAIAWEMATGKVAFEGQNVAQILMRIVNEDPPPPSSMSPKYPAAFDDVVLGGLRKDKTQWPGSVGELADRVVKSFGLDGDHGKWAAASLEEVARALSVTTPPEPAPLAPAAPAPTAPAAAPTAPSAPTEDTRRATEPIGMHASEIHGGSKGPGVGLIVGIAVAALLVGGALAYFFLR